MATKKITPLVLLSIFLLNSVNILAQRIETVNNHTYRVRGHNQNIILDKGSIVTMDNEGYILSGYLGQTYSFQTVSGEESVPFKAGSYIKFNKNGVVVGGTLARSVTLQTCGNNLPSLIFKGGSKINFSTCGVIDGTLGSDYTLNSTFYKSGTSLSFSFGRISVAF